MSRLTLACVALCAFAACLLSTTTQAGDRPIELLLVNLTPDPVSTESRRCSAEIRRQLQRNDVARLHQLGETALLARTGRSDPRDFMQWPTAVLSALRTSESTREVQLDAVALFDCRPEAEALSVVVLAPSGGAAHIVLSGPVPVGRGRFLAERIVHHAWIGFSP